MAKNQLTPSYGTGSYVSVKPKGGKGQRSSNLKPKNAKSSKSTKSTRGGYGGVSRAESDARRANTRNFGTNNSLKYLDQIMTANPSRKLSSPPGYGPGGPLGQQGMPELPWYNKTLNDFLSQAMGMVGSGPDFSGQENAARKNNADVSGRMAALYKLLNEQNVADMGSAAEVGDANRAAMQAATDQATGVIQDGASADQAVMEAALRQGQNMQGVEGLLANYRTADETQAALGDVSARGQDYMNVANTAAQNADTGFRNNMATLRSQHYDYEGANARNLLSQLAEIETMRAQAAQDREARAQSFAMQLMNDDYGRWMDQTRYNSDIEQTAWDRGVYEQDRLDSMSQLQQEQAMRNQPQTQSQSLSAQEEAMLFKQATAQAKGNGIAQPDYEDIMVIFEQLRNRYLGTKGISGGGAIQANTAGTAPGRARGGFF